VPTFVDSGVSRGQRGRSPTVVNLSFLDRSRYFSFKQFLIYSQKACVDPVPDPPLLRKSGSAGNRTRDLCASSQEGLKDITYIFFVASYSASSSTMNKRAVYSSETSVGFQPTRERGIPKNRAPLKCGLVKVA
jgi:hypothetical protein